MQRGFSHLTFHLTEVLIEIFSPARRGRWGTMNQMEAEGLREAVKAGLQGSLGPGGRP